MRRSAEGLDANMLGAEGALASSSSSPCGRFTADLALEQEQLEAFGALPIARSDNTALRRIDGIRVEFEVARVCSRGSSQAADGSREPNDHCECVVVYRLGIDGKEPEPEACPGGTGSRILPLFSCFPTSPGRLSLSTAYSCLSIVPTLRGHGDLVPQ